MSDITNADALQRFETIWQHVECGIAIIDPATRQILDMNPVAARMYGDDPEKLRGKVCHKVFCPAQESACPIIDLGQVVDRSERKFVKSDGSMIPIVKSVAKIQYNGREALLESFTDISSLKEAEAKLMVLQVAEQANRAKSDFLSRMSHEMRTPMNAIIGMTKIAEHSADLPRLKYCLSMIGASSEHLLSLINDVLDMSKIEAGKFDLESAPFILENAVRKICDLIVDKTDAKNIALRVHMAESLGTWYVGDELRLCQVIANLLSNSVKFTPEGGSIHLEASEVARQGGKAVLRFVVTDTGIGMTEEQAGKLFTAFEQADTSISRRFGGTGLGLAISKNIVEKMNGSISVASESGEGSSFTVEVELGLPEKDEEHVQLSHDAAALRILVVADDKHIREQLAAIAKRFGIRLEVAATGEEGLTLIVAAANEGEPHDVIFLEHALPDMAVLDAVARLSPETDRKSVVIMCSFAHWNTLDDVREAGVSRFLPKPLFASTFVGAINDVLTGAGHAAKEDGSSAAPPDFSGISLLLAEDVPINREIFATLLEETKVRIRFAENGRVALNMFAASPEEYDIIFMDVQMPDMDGYEATRQIRALPDGRGAKVPIIAMTANVFTEDIAKCLNCGMNGHLAKPIDEAAVVEKIRQLCPGK